MPDPDLIDLLAAMADYFEARREYNEAFEGYDGYSFDWHGRSYIERLDLAYQCVQREWSRAMQVPA